MKKLLLTICILFIITSCYGQYSYTRFNLSRDSLLQLMNINGEESLKYKDTDTQKADKYATESNHNYQLLLNLIVSNIDNCSSQEIIAKILDDNLYILEREYNEIKKILSIINKYQNFDPILKSKITLIYNELNKEQMVGKTALDFTLPDSNGKQVSLSSLKGKYVWLNFWASWCASCRVKTRHTVTIYDEITKMDIVVLSVALDEKEQVWRDANTKDGICWLSLRDAAGFDGKLKNDYKIVSLPTTFLINPNGEIVLQNCDAQQVMNYIKNNK